MKPFTRRLATLVSAASLAVGAAVAFGAPANAVELYGDQNGFVEIQLSPYDVLDIGNPFIDKTPMCEGIAGEVNDFWASLALPRTYSARACVDELVLCVDLAVAPAGTGQPSNPYVRVVVAPDLTYACGTYTP